MAFRRLFTDAELVEFEKAPSQLATEALTEGNLPRVKELLDEMAAGPKPLHVLGLHTLARMWGKYRALCGETKTDKALRLMAGRLVDHWAERWQSGKVRETIASLVAIYRNQSGARLNATETPDAITIDLAPCGSGGMLIRQKWAERQPALYAPFDDGTPVFCRGCKALQAEFNARCGSDVWRTEIASDGSGACRMTFAKPAGTEEPLFDDPQALTRTRVDDARERIAQGRTDIEELLPMQQHDWKPWHDFKLCWLEYSFAAFHEVGGYDLLRQVFLECYESVFYPRYAVFEQWSDRERLQRTAWTWHYHMGRFRIIEEEHRFALILDPCGSGARLFRGDVQEPPFAYGKPGATLTTEPHMLSFGRTEFPLYCSHCAATNATQIDGLPLIFFIDGHAQLRPGMPCRQYLYKKGAPREVEMRLLQQIGRDRVAPLDSKSVEPDGRQT
jgi:hypothetical protein